MKRIFAFIFAVIMLVGVICSCGKKENNNSTLKIGGIGPITGDTAVYGEAVKNGCKLAVEEINKNGGIGGLKVEFKFEDDMNDADKSVSVYDELKKWGMNVLVGPVTTIPCIEVAEKVYADRVFAITPSASSSDVTKGKDNMYQLCFSNSALGTGAASYISENMKDKKIAVIYRNDDAYSQGVRDTFVAEANSKNLEVVFEGTFTAETSKDFTVQLTNAKNAKADIIFLPVYYQSASTMLAQAKVMNYTPTLFGVDGLDGILTMENFDTTLAEGLVILTSFSAYDEDENTKAFVEKYKETYGEIPNQFAADGYDCIYAIKAAYEKMGCTSDMSQEILCEKLVKGMQEISFDGLTGKEMKWNDRGEVDKQPMVVVIENGVYVSSNTKSE